jgi:hypothetical protein
MRCALLSNAVRDIEQELTGKLPKVAREAANVTLDPGHYFHKLSKRVGL